MNPDIGKMRCPVCGTQAGARLNKNGIIYTNCPNGHQAKLNKPDSHAALVALQAGKSWNNGLIFIYPNERKLENDGTNKPTTGTDSAGVNYGRPNGQPSTNSTVDNGTDTESDDDGFSFGLI